MFIDHNDPRLGREHGTDTRLYQLVGIDRAYPLLCTLLLIAIATLSATQGGKRGTTRGQKEEDEGRKKKPSGLFHCINVNHMLTHLIFLVKKKKKERKIVEASLLFREESPRSDAEDRSTNTQGKRRRWRNDGRILENTKQQKDDTCCTT